MLKSIFKNKSTIKIKKHSFFAKTKNLNQGLGYIVLEVDENTVSGIQITQNKISKFSSKRVDFENHIIYKLIEFVEVLPNDVVVDFESKINK